jgi:hypothetical protein
MTSKLMAASCMKSMLSAKGSDGTDGQRHGELDAGVAELEYCDPA